MPALKPTLMRTRMPTLMPTSTPIALVLDDEREIRYFVRSSLEAEGWQVVEAGTIKQGRVEAGTRRPDLVIADLGLPDGDGVDFIRQLRAWSGVPIIVLSARTQESDKVAALDAGADDFITKPFGVAELLARTRANMRRVRAGRAAPDATFRFGEVEVDLAARIVRKQGQELHLTPIEYRLLGVLIGNAGRVLTHPYLLREVWGPTHAQSTHYLRVYMGNLRQKLERNSAQPRHIVRDRRGLSAAAGLSGAVVEPQHPARRIRRSTGVCRMALPRSAGLGYARLMIWFSTAQACAKTASANLP